MKCNRLFKYLCIAAVAANFITAGAAMSADRPAYRTGRPAYRTNASALEIFYEIEVLGEKWKSFSPCQKLFVLGYAAYKDGRFKEAERHFSACDGGYPLLQGYITDFLNKIRSGVKDPAYVDISKQNAAEIRKMEERLKAGGMSYEDRIELKYQLAKAYFRGRRYDDASAMFEETAVAEKYRLASLEYLATSLARLEKYQDAIIINDEIISEYPANKTAVAKAMFKIGFLYLDDGDYAEAKREFLRLQRVSSSHQRDQVRWYLAWCEYKLGNFKEASKKFADLKRAGGRAWRGRGEYWYARMMEEMGRREDAADGFRKIAMESPYTYYGILAAGRLGDGSHVVIWNLPPADDEACDGNETGDCRTASYGAAGGEGGADGLETAYELDRLDLGELVGVELDNYLSLNFKKRGIDWTEVYNLARRNDAWNIVNRLARGGLYRRANGFNARLIWEGSYPKAYSKAVMEFSAKTALDPLFVWSIMREESTFKADAVSKSGAIGLMQIMPYTAERMAASPSNFHIRQLFIPRKNIEIGVRYLNFLMRRYNGDMFLAAAAYNAGEEAVDRWLGRDRKTGGEKFDPIEFVEEIPYKETIDYVRKVMKTYWLYKELYRG